MSMMKFGGGGGGVTHDNRPFLSNHLPLFYSESCAKPFI